MKILFVSHTYHPDVNGIQFVTQFLAQKLAESGHSISVLTDSPAVSGDGFINGVNILKIQSDFCEMNKRIHRFSLEGDLIVFVASTLLLEKYPIPELQDIYCKTLMYVHGIHCFKWDKTNFISAKEVIKKIIKDIYWQVTYFNSRKRIRKFDGVIHLHEKDYSYRLFEKWKLNKNFYLYNFAEEMFFQKGQKNSDGNRILIYISNYHVRKNQMMLLRAFYALTEENIKLICIGAVRNTYYEKMVKEEAKLAAKYGKKEVGLLYRISRKELVEYLKQAYAFIMPSLAEGFPIVIAEAMASGLPFISTDVGINKYLPGGMIVAPNTSSLCKGMDFLLKHPNERNRMAKEASLYAKEHLSPEAYVRHFMEIVARL